MKCVCIALSYSPNLLGMESVRFTIFASGSAGNAAYLETSGARLLIDCGISAKRIREGLLSLDRTPERLDGILITHEHSDHIRGLRVFAAKLGIPVYCNRHTSAEIHRIHDTKFNFRIVETGCDFQVGDLTVDTFSVPHDAIDPIGFVLHTPAAQIGFLTDMGHGTRLVADRVKDTEVLLLETNHDVEMLNNDPRRSWALKQRIMSRHGHLSNEAAAEFLEQLAHNRLEHIFCAHLSRDCNTPELAKTEITQKLVQIGLPKVTVHLTSQSILSPTLEIFDKKTEILTEKTVATPSIAL